MEYITIHLHNGATLSADAARLLVDYALERLGRPAWKKMCVELFAGGAGESLAIARPAVRLRVSIADYALPALEKLRSGGK